MHAIPAAERMKEEKDSWGSSFQWLRGRSLEGAKLMVVDRCLDMRKAVGKVFPKPKVKPRGGHAAPVIERYQILPDFFAHNS